jgi:hypothetical protein
LLRPSSARAAWWAWTSLRRSRADLRELGLRARVTPPPAAALTGDIGVRAVLRTVTPTCLERCLVLQAWLAAHGSEVDIVVGVPRDSARPLGPANPAHAWLATESTPALTQQYAVLRRITFGPS